MTARLPGLSLFWRTFFLLALLLAGGVFAWVQTLRALEFEPRAVQAAQQTAGLVNLFTRFGDLKIRNAKHRQSERPLDPSCRSSGHQSA